MTIDTFQALYLTLAFLVPGFIAQSAMGMFVTQRPEESRATLLRFLTLSCLNYAPWSPLVYLIFKLEFFGGHPLLTSCSWFLIVFASPILLGTFLGHLSQREWVRRLLIRVGLRPIHSVPTAWDLKFQQQQPRWVLVTLKDGAQVAGWFGDQSFASSEPVERDLYVEKLYNVHLDRPWEPVVGGDGLLIRGDEIRHVEFWYD